MSEIQKETAQELVETLKQVPTNKYHVLNQKLATQFAERIADDNLCNEAILSIQTDPEIDKVNAERIVEFIEMIKSSRQNFVPVQAMINHKEQAELEPEIIDVTEQFLNLDVFDFEDFMEPLKDKPTNITVNWRGLDNARKIKALMGTFFNLKATIKATQKQYEEGWNVFSSGVKWEKVEN